MVGGEAAACAGGAGAAGGAVLRAPPLSGSSLPVVEEGLHES